jgi:hypothetical protein
VKLRVLSRLGMLTTGDPVAELDDDLARLTVDLHACRARGDQAMAARLADVIDGRLDERHGFTTEPTGHPVRLQIAAATQPSPAPAPPICSTPAPPPATAK